MKVFEKKYRLQGMILSGVILLLITIGCFVKIKRNEQESFLIHHQEGYLVQIASEEEETGRLGDLFVLNSGTYSFDFLYTASSEGNRILLYQNDVLLGSYELPTIVDGHFKIKIQSKTIIPELEVKYQYCGNGYLGITEYKITPEKRWTSDGYLVMILVWILYGTGCVLIRLWDKGKKKEVIDFTILAGIAVIASLQAFKGNKIQFGDDERYHITRIDGIAMGLQTGQFPVYVYPIGHLGSGYLNRLYPSIFLYVPALLRILGASYLFAYGFMCLGINLFTSFVTYLSLKTVQVRREICLFGSIFYSFMIYRYNNLYIRSAIGEVIAMIFIPLIIVGLYHVLYGDQKKWWMLCLGISGTIQSHMLSTVLYAAFVVVLLICFGFRLLKENRWVSMVKVGISTILLNLFYIVPFAKYYLQSNLRLDALDNQQPKSYLLSFGEIWGIDKFHFYEAPQYTLDICYLCMVILAIIVLVQKRKKMIHKNIYWIICGALSFLYILFASSLIPYDRLVSNAKIYQFYHTLQFPFRLIGVAGGVMIIVCMIIVSQRKFSSEKIVYGLLAGILVLNAFSMRNEMRSVNNNYTNNRVGEKICFQGYNFPLEYLIQGTIDENVSEYRVSDDNIEIVAYQKKNLDVDISYNSKTDGYITLPLQNYMGYHIYDEDGNEKQIYTSDEGYIKTEVSNDGQIHKLHVRFQEPNICRASEIVSFAFICIWIAIAIIKKRTTSENSKRGLILKEVA